ncbi:tyrosine-type recombinase/integrase [Pseudofrankia sp. DC12]|uniref:tyrosine-type recombinase/integrase n=1 Tax=Pseudofrankia sp. DC12 TaxID=683315 RepID=UPI0012F7BD3D
MQREVRVSATGLPGSARLEIVENVVPLDQAGTTFEAMLSGWARQQRARFLREAETIAPRLALVRRLVAFSGLFPWEWTPAEGEAFISDRRSGSRPVSVSTARGYEVALRMFCEYVTDPRYEWPRVCEERFGRCPAQIFHEWNSVAHVVEYEGSAGRRPLTYDEVQALFDAADGLVEEIRGRGRKGALPAMRDAALLKTIYAFGLRRREARGLDLTDLRRSPKTAQYGQYGALFVRYGKASRGSPPKRRTVLTVPEMDWVVEVLAHWVGELRPLFGPGPLTALWVTERASRISTRGVNEAFETARRAAGLPAELDLHCLRHSYVTHLVEFDYPERFVAEQVGHRCTSTTAIYTGVSDEYRNRLVRRSLERHEELWERAQ